MAMSDTAPELGCGRSIDDVWARIDSPPDAHEQQCSDCQAARASLAKLRLATDDLRAHPPQTPSLGVKDAVMAVARAEVRRGRRLPVRTDEVGALQLSEQIVASVVREAADSVPGVHARRCSVALDEPGDRGVIPEAGVREIDVVLGVAMAVGPSIPRVLAELRAVIRTEVERRLGVVTAQVDITVEDLYDVEVPQGVRVITSEAS
jgi:uncharacterized alkaline shock family protein YloU